MTTTTMAVVCPATGGPDISTTPRSKWVLNWMFSTNSVTKFGILSFTPGEETSIYLIQLNHFRAEHRQYAMR